MIFIAYHGNESEKAAILAQLRAHYEADEIIKGQYWEGGKGCAVGCTIHSGDHAEYEPRFGIPQALAKLEDIIFENLPNGHAKEWPLRFMSAIHPGADLSRVSWQFLHWLLTDEGMEPGINHPLVRDAVKQCADVLVPLTKGQAVDARAARSAARAAWSAAESARRAALSAAESAARARSARSAARAAEIWWSAALSARRAALRAAESGWSAARAAEIWWSAALSAGSAAESTGSAARSAGSAAYLKMADKLIQLLEAS